MQQGKHQEYEKKLQEQLVNNTASQIKEKYVPPVSGATVTNMFCITSNNNNTTNNNSLKEAWPSLLQGGNREDGEEVGTPLATVKSTRHSHKSESAASSTQLNGGGGTSNHKKRHTSGEEPRG
jgi:hypothetical protein